MKGRKPLPKSVKEAQGTLEKSRINQLEPEIKENVSREPPKGMSARAKRHWKEIIEAHGVDWIAKCDGKVLVQFCEVCADLDECTSQIKKNGRFYVDADGVTRESVAMKTKARFLPLFRSLASELGLTPSSRTRVQVLDSDKKDKSTSFLSMFSEKELKKSIETEALN